MKTGIRPAAALTVEPKIAADGDQTSQQEAADLCSASFFWKSLLRFIALTLSCCDSFAHVASAAPT